MHTGLAGLAFVQLITGLFLLNAMVFLTLRATLGDVGALGVMCAGHFAAAAVVLAIALREPKSRELDALVEAEHSALRAVNSEAGAILSAIKSIESRLESLGANVALAVGALSMLSSMTKASEGQRPAVAKPVDEGGPPKGIQPDQ